ncbi:phage tail sheath family protein [Nocardia asiatica]|uniref:phage tail sheath family protein n=1 Tax=Nocardia asiatica TaxID=209252 RepID=UPI002458184C|nr:phage tail sheath subtilisin-like domain-containing protein [Nocardia asiatica]
MTVPLSPGVYVRETPLTPSIAGVGTSTAAFIGESTVAENEMPFGPDGTRYKLVDEGVPFLVTNWEQFKRQFGDFGARNVHLAHSVYGFFNNGGSRCWVARVTDLDDAAQVDAVLVRMEAIDEVSIVAAPGALNHAVRLKLVEHCEKLKDRVAVLDGNDTKTITVDAIKGAVKNSDFAAIYFPWIEVSDPVSGSTIAIPPSGLVAGVYARVDGERGVHKAPANEPVNGALGLTYRLSTAEQDGLNPHGINAIRLLNGTIRVWGARTMGGDLNEAAGGIKYVNIRRLMNFLRESIDEGTQFAVFEPNSDPLWQRITRSVNGFLTGVWRDGALFGTVPEEAFRVICDETTNPPDVRARGQVVTEVWVAPVKPAEFVMFRIAQVNEIPA